MIRSRIAICRSCDAPGLAEHLAPGSCMFNDWLTAPMWPSVSSEKIQVFGAAATGDISEFDRGEQSAGDIDFAVERRRQRVAETDGVRDGWRCVNGGMRIDPAHDSSESLRIRALVMRTGAD